MFFLIVVRVVGEGWWLWTLHIAWAIHKDGRTKLWKRKYLPWKIAASKLKGKCWNHKSFMNLPGRPNIVCFRDMASYSLYEQKKKTGETKESIVTAALRDLDKLNKVYPTFDQLSNIKDQKQWVPESLQLLLSYLIPFELKQVIIVILCCFFFFLIQIIKNNNLKSHKL